MSAYTGIRYYAVRTNPRCERRARWGLHEAGFTVYLPVEVKLRKLPAKLYARTTRLLRPVERVEVPLMPGYLFVQVDHDRQGIASIRAVHGVSELVGINGAPAAISERDIATLRKIEAEVNAAHANPEPAYAKGEEVKVKSGMWQGHVGRFMAESPEGRIRLLFDGKFIKGPQEFEAEQVEKAA